MDQMAEEERGPNGGSRVRQQRPSERGVVPGRLNVEEEWHTGMEAHAEDAEEGAWWRAHGGGRSGGVESASGCVAGKL
jgi:hypothetical protein